jgi:hypothetical protein
MRVTFVDESGRAGDTEFVGMAACDARWPVWQEFNRRWTAALQRHATPYLHMKEFTGFRGPYKGWTEAQRRGLMADCLAALDGLTIDMMSAVMKPADFEALPPDQQAAFDDPYLCVFQECLHGIALSGYMDSLLTKVDVIYSQQDEFRTRFRRMFELWRATSEDGPCLGHLAFRDMRECPGLQLADLVAYETTHYYHLKANHPHLRPRYPFLKLCEHQLSLQSGGFKFIPGWKLALKASGYWAPVQDIIWTDIEAWRGLIRQLFPEEIMPESRLQRLVFLRNRTDALERLRAREIRRER